MSIQISAAGTGRHGGVPVGSVIVDSNDVSQWFGEYLDAFAACGRGENDTASLLAYYGVPLLLTPLTSFPGQPVVTVTASAGPTFQAGSIHSSS